MASHFVIFTVLSVFLLFFNAVDAEEEDTAENDVEERDEKVVHIENLDARRRKREVEGEGKEDVGEENEERDEKVVHIENLDARRRKREEEGEGKEDVGEENEEKGEESEKRRRKRDDNEEEKKKSDENSKENNDENSEVETEKRRKRDDNDEEKEKSDENSKEKVDENTEKRRKRDESGEEKDDESNNENLDLKINIEGIDATDLTNAVKNLDDALIKAVEDAESCGEKDRHELEELQQEIIKTANEEKVEDADQLKKLLQKLTESAEHIHGKLEELLARADPECANAIKPVVETLTKLHDAIAETEKLV